MVVECTPADIDLVRRHAIEICEHSLDSDSDAILVRCSDKTFTHEILSDDNDTTLEFVSDSFSVDIVRIHL
jgi:hypothetical protein